MDWKRFESFASRTSCSVGFKEQEVHFQDFSSIAPLAQALESGSQDLK